MQDDVVSVVLIMCYAHRVSSILRLIVVLYKIFCPQILYNRSLIIRRLYLIHERILFAQSTAELWDVLVARDNADPQMCANNVCTDRVASSSVICDTRCNPCVANIIYCSECLATLKLPYDRDNTSWDMPPVTEGTTFITKQILLPKQRAVTNIAVFIPRHYDRTYDGLTVRDNGCLQPFHVAKRVQHPQWLVFVVLDAETPERMVDFCPQRHCRQNRSV